MTARDYLYAVAALSSIVVVCLSFLASPSKDPPVQEINPRTGFPVWHQILIGEVKEETKTFTLLAFTFATISAYVGFRAVRPPACSMSAFVTLKTGKEQNSAQINTFILYYIYVTWWAIVGYMYFDAGKIWSVVGTLHNLLEVVLLIAFHSGGRITSVTFALWMFAYVVSVILLCVYLQWPYDAIFFRWQGLCSDFALIIMFARLYITTKQQLKEHGGPDKHDEELARRVADDTQHQHPVYQQRRLQELQQQREDLLAQQRKLEQRREQPEVQHQLQELKDRLAEVDDELFGLQYRRERRQLFRSSVATFTSATPIQSEGSNGTFSHANGNGVPKNAPNGIPEHDKPIWAVVWHNPRQLWLLIAAAVAHVLGNVLTTIFPTSTLALASFLISYALSFPAYAYYLYIDYHALRPTKIYLPEFGVVKNFTVAAWSIFCSTAIIRVGLWTATHFAKNTGA